MTAPPNRRDLMGVGGLRLAADYWPGGDRGFVLLSHGGGQTRHAWGETGAMLAAKGYEVLSVDLRGHGDSAWDPHHDYRIETFSADLITLLETMDVGPAILIGASLGGIASLLAAGGEAAFRIRALVLVDITPHPRLEGIERIRAFMNSAPEGFADLDAAADAVAAYLPGRRRPRSTAGLMKNLRERGGRLHWHWDPQFLAVTSHAHEASGAVQETIARRITAPTLLVRGQQSEVVSAEDAEAFRRLVPHSELVEVEDAAHMVAGDHNTVFGEAVVSFLAALPPL